MFEIEYKGGNTITLATKKMTAVVDANQAMNGLKSVSVKGAVQIATEERFLVNGADAVLSIEGPGEYEVSDFSIRGVAAVRHIDDPATAAPVSTIYRVEVEGVRIAVIGNIAPTLSENQLEEIGVVDMVIVPVGGGGYTLDATSAAALVRQIEPVVVVPVHYADSAISYEVPQDDIATFTGELGAPVETVSKYRLKGASSLPQALTTVVIERS